MKHIVVALSLILACVLYPACNSTEYQGGTPEAPTKLGLDTLPASFEEFYERFHSDTSYQLAHITFPLEGKPSEDVFGPEYTNFRWTRDGWRIHQPIADDDDTFEKKYVILSPDLVIERIESPTYGFFMERRFAQMSDGWNLIYFMDMQKPEGFME